MQVVYPVCCGLEVHQAQRTACLRQGDGAGHVTQEVPGVWYHDERVAHPAGVARGTALSGRGHGKSRGCIGSPFPMYSAGQWTSWWAIRMRGGVAQGARQTRPMRGGSRSCLPMASFARALSRCCPQ